MMLSSITVSSLNFYFRLPQIAGSKQARGLCRRHETVLLDLVKQRTIADIQ
jgi:hypothetical protein